VERDDEIQFPLFKKTLHSILHLNHGKEESDIFGIKAKEQEMENHSSA
jgi:hypothetical protein